MYKKAGFPKERGKNIPIITKKLKMIFIFQYTCIFNMQKSESLRKRVPNRFYKENQAVNLKNRK